jgi:phosphoribosylglycinamide formyltransferase 1
MHRIAIFASGSGTNAENIIRYFQNKPRIKVSCICTNRADAYVTERVRPYKIPVLVFSRQDFYESGKILDYLEENKIDWIILAGFLWLIPENLINRYSSRIINIHPALLPKYGGKGMYGASVHKAVIENGEKQSGITIHFVNNEYDKGNIIFQVACNIDPADTPDTLASKVHALEYEHFPRVIEEVVERGEVRGER